MKGIILLILIAGTACKKDATPAAPAKPFSISSVVIDNQQQVFKGIARQPSIKINGSDRIKVSSIAANILFADADGNKVPFVSTAVNNDSSIVLVPVAPLQALKKFQLTVSTGLQSSIGNPLSAGISQTFSTGIDSTDKFTRVSDDALLNLIEQQSLRYFTELAHPISGMALERSNGDANTCTTGGTGFGIMSIIVGIERHFITRAEGLALIQRQVQFLTTKATRYHGAFAHWINGNTGATIPFSENDNGGDLVETSFLLQGLLCARQYFAGLDPVEQQLRDDINGIWQAVEWTWFTQNGQRQLYWHWSPTVGFAINLPIRGWNEALITYVVAASASNPITKDIYDNGWAANGNMKNGNTYYNILLPVGPALGGPLFFSQYSFLGLNPLTLSDSYARYMDQNTAHASINFSYCVANPKSFYGYSALCWGLTASDEQGGYGAHSPANDNGTISPTAAIASIPYTSIASMDAIRFFYYTLGDKLWGKYGFVDAFNLDSLWFAPSYLAIDQGPQIIMIENYRSGLLWNLFSNCPEIKQGLKRLGFTANYL